MKSPRRLSVWGPGTPTGERRNAYIGSKEATRACFSDSFSQRNYDTTCSRCLLFDKGQGSVPLLGDSLDEIVTKPSELILERCIDKLLN
jgi:hypothetical protein